MHSRCSVVAMWIASGGREYEYRWKRGHLTVLGFLEAGDEEECSAIVTETLRDVRREDVLTVLLSLLM